MSRVDYNWGILGTGSIAHSFAKGLKMLPRCNLHSVHSRTFKKAQRFANTYGFKSTHKNSKSFLQDPELDIVYIATPSHLHAQQTVECLNEGKHVLVEKPLALNVTQAQKIEQAAKQNDRFCMEAMWSRFLPLYQEVKKIVHDGVVGDVKLLSAEFGKPLPYDPEKFRYSIEKGGGSLLDLGVYPISLCLMLLGQPVRVEGECRKAESGVDVLSQMSLYYQNGAIADLRSSFNCELSNTMWIGGTRGAIEIPRPIYRPDYYKLHRYSFGNGQSKLSRGLRSKLHEIPLISDMLPIVRKTVLNPIREYRAKNPVPHKGNGYQYQAREVMEVLDRGGRESEVMPLRDSISALEITDKLRRDWEILFPAIDQKEI